MYENRVPRTLDALPISNMQRVMVPISDVSATTADVAGYFEPEGWEVAKHDDVGLDEVRRALASIPGSLASAASASREET